MGLLSSTVGAKSFFHWEPAQWGWISFFHFFKTSFLTEVHCCRKLEISFLGWEDLPISFFNDIKKSYRRVSFF